MSTQYIERPLVRPGTTFKDHTPPPRTIKCLHCKERKAPDAFYTLQTGRASKHCIGCNRVATLKAKYQRELRREGVAGFALRLARKEEQLALMHEAVKEFKEKS